MKQAAFLLVMIALIYWMGTTATKEPTDIYVWDEQNPPHEKLETNPSCDRGDGWHL